MPKALPMHVPDLPPGQVLIETSLVKEIDGLLNLMSKTELNYASMGLITAPIGAGKSTAIYHALSFSRPLEHTVLPPRLKVPLNPYITERDLAWKIASTLEESIDGFSWGIIPQKLVEMIHDLDIKLLVFDYGEYLNRRVLKLLCWLHQEARIPFVIVGRPEIKTLAENTGKFYGFLLYELHLSGLKKQEMLAKFLKNVSFPRWIYDSKNDKDRSLGDQIWQLCRPNLRKLFQFLQAADQIAQVSNVDKIDEEIIKDTIEATFGSEENGRRSQEADQESGEDNEESIGPQEQAAHDRQEKK